MTGFVLHVLKEKNKFRLRLERGTMLSFVSFVRFEESK